MPRINSALFIKLETRDKKKRQTTFHLYSHPGDPDALTLHSVKDMVNGLDYSLTEIANKIVGEVTYKFTYVVHPEMAKQLLEATEWPAGLEDY